MIKNLLDEGLVSAAQEICWSSIWWIFVRRDLIILPLSHISTLHVNQLIFSPHLDFDTTLPRITRCHVFPVKTGRVLNRKSYLNVLLGA